MSKMTVEQFKKWFYETPHSYKEIAERFGYTSVAGVVRFRQRHNLPARGWAYGPPQTGVSRPAWNRGMFGKKNLFWKGGKTKASNGYTLIYNPDYPEKSASKYIGEHRYIMEQFLGRKLAKCEIVHHINGNKTDNRIENLELTNEKEHARLHRENHFQKGHLFHKR